MRSLVARAIFGLGYPGWLSVKVLACTRPVNQIKDLLLVLLRLFVLGLFLGPLVPAHHKLLEDVLFHALQLLLFLLFLVFRHLQIIIRVLIEDVLAAERVDFLEFELVFFGLGVGVPDLVLDSVAYVFSGYLPNNTAFELHDGVTLL